MNGLRNLAEVLENGNNEIFVDPAIGKRSRARDRPHARFRRRQKGQGAADRRDLAKEANLFSGVGPA